MTYEIALAVLLSQYEGVLVEPEELICLSRNVYHEARGESRVGQIAVAHVTINRVRADGFGESICEVVTAESQFSWTSDGKADTPTSKEEYLQSMKIALEVIGGEAPDPTDGATYFYNPDEVEEEPNWARQFAETAVIENHRFMKE